jgi:NAD(P)-dependent dehydrogenase (short-subunit alcohol dehydrogenase family)
MRINGQTALVTGANRGIGAALSQALLDRGAAKVYAAVRNPETVTDPRLTPLRLDVTDPREVAAAAEAAQDVTIVINNAGQTSGGTRLLDGDLDGARRAMEVNFYGTWSVSRAFAPVLAAHGGGALVNVLSAASWWAIEGAPGYSASKAAQWSLTNALRQGLRKQGTQVLGVHCAFVDTDLSAGVDAPKLSADEVAEHTLRALEDDADEVLIDEFTRKTRAALAGGIAGLHEIGL